MICFRIDRNKRWIVDTFVDSCVTKNNLKCIIHLINQTINTYRNFQAIIIRFVVQNIKRFTSVIQLSKVCKDTLVFSRKQLYIYSIRFPRFGIYFFRSEEFFISQLRRDFGISPCADVPFVFEAR